MFKYKKYTENEAITLFEDVLNITLSNEQKAILVEPISHPLLVNASAGSGKTTVFILKAILNVLVGNIEPQNILGITFSKKAQENMENRYQKYIDRLNENEPIIDAFNQPQFSTFHSFFFNLLRLSPTYKRTKVIPSLMSIQYQLKSYITKSSTTFASEYDILESIANLHDYLIVKGYSRDGLIVNGKDLVNYDLEDLENDIGQSISEPLIEDYIDVITAYNEHKANENLIDFNDMTVITQELIETDENFRQDVLNYTAHFQYLAIDEFQDINKMQWIVTSGAFTEEQLQSLTAIGDDDQSIYSFRGSTPEFILNFHEYIDNAITLNLSTNYRTFSNVLEEGAKVVMNNTIRLNKDLLAFNQGGKANFVRTSPFANLYNNLQANKGQTNFFTTLKEYAQNSANKDRTAAILLRYNSDRSLITDWLADQQIYIQQPIDLSTKKDTNLIQNNNYYRVFMRLAYAIWYDNAEPYLELSKYIGFKTYTESIENFLVGNPTYRPSAVNKVSLIGLVNALANQPIPGGLPLSIIKDRKSKQKMNRHVVDLLTQVRSLKRNQHTDALVYLGQTVVELTNLYFNYMTEHGYISKHLIDDVRDYLLFKLEMNRNLTVDEFFDKEVAKNKQVVLPSNETSNFEILTIHQAKGLEFDDVFVYGLTTRTLSPNQYKISQWFPANLTDDEFKAQWSSIVLHKREFSSVLKSVLEQYSPTIASKLPKSLPLHLDDLVINDSLRARALGVAQMNVGGRIMNYLRANSQMIEEERRLIYVSYTRAKDNLVVNVATDKQKSVLLKESAH